MGSACKKQYDKTKTVAAESFDPADASDGGRLCGYFHYLGKNRLDAIGILALPVGNCCLSLPGTPVDPSAPGGLPPRKDAGKQSDVHGTLYADSGILGVPYAVLDCGGRHAGGESFSMDRKGDSFRSSPGLGDAWQTGRQKGKNPAFRRYRPVGIFDFQPYGEEAPLLLL